mgnify:FL=1
MINLKSKYTPFFIAITSLVILNVIIFMKFFIKDIKHEKYVRLHVIANSDSNEDQIIKFKVNEKINSYLNSFDLTFKNNEEVMDFLKTHTSNIENIVSETLSENNIKYNSYIKIGKVNFEKKDNFTSSMESGTYNSLNIILGKGNGKNIWSIIFPNEEKMSNLSNLETILPKISDIYQDNTPKTYSIKLLELLDTLPK